MRTRQLAEYIGKRYGLPVERLAMVYSDDYKRIAEQLQCSLLEAVELQLKAAFYAAPYIHEKRRQAVDLNVNMGLSERLRAARQRGLTERRMTEIQVEVLQDSDIVVPGR